MMKHNKRFSVKTLVSLLVAAVMLLSALPFAAAEEDPVVASGDCGASGDNVKWELTLHGILTLSGTGAMQDYAKRDDLPWRQKMVLRVIVSTKGSQRSGTTRLIKWHRYMKFHSPKR